MTENRYTLAEAQQRLNQIECATHGHDFDMLMTNMSNDPVGMVCSSCGRRWSVTND